MITSFLDYGSFQDVEMKLKADFKSIKIQFPVQEPVLDKNQIKIQDKIFHKLKNKVCI